MPVSVVVGGQFGSEGKGKVALELARQSRATVVIRVGGSNSGHTAVDDDGCAHIFRALPTAALLPDTICALGAGSYIDVDVLLEEIRNTGISPDRLVIDPNAVVISSDDKTAEARSSLRERIGSTASGTGAAVIRRIQRVNLSSQASSDPRLDDYVRPLTPLLRSRLKRGERCLIEGTQGFGLSLLHSVHYPNVTSRDTSAAAFVAEAGLSPLDVDDVVMVLRAYPIRVPGNSGELPKCPSGDFASRANRLIGVAA